MSIRTLSLAVVLALAAVACGGSSGDGVASTAASETIPSGESPAPDASAADATPASGEVGVDPGPTATDIPDVDVIDVRTGQPVALRSFVPSDKPLLFWFWAPH